jgi:D-3-phosphoglycerate dehydrogenase
MATPARDIATPSNRLERTVSQSLSVSTSPTTTFHSPPSSIGRAQLTRQGTGVQPPKPLKPFDTQDIKILLLENVNQSGRDILEAQGYQVEALKTSLPEDQLIEKIRYDVVCYLF